MFKSILTSITLTLLVFSVSISSAESPLPIQCSRELQSHLKIIQKLPEANNLISQIQKEGSFKIHINNNSSVSRTFGAFWDSENRVIFVCPTRHSTENEIVGSIVFELHNAANDSKFRRIFSRASSGNLQKTRFINEMEHIEYENAAKAYHLVEKGINSGLYPKEARLSNYPNFETYMSYQKIGGHSECLGKIYDSIVSQNGKSLMRN